MSTALGLVPFNKPDLSKIPRAVSKTLSKTDRQALLAYSQTKSITEAGHCWGKMRGITYQDDSAANSCMSRKISDIRDRLEKAGAPELFWEALGLDAMRIARALADGMEATVVKPMMGKQSRVLEYEEEEGKVKRRVVDEEVIVYPDPQPDHQSRINAAVNTARLRGDLKRGESATITAGVQGEGFKFLFVMEQKS